MDKTKTSGKRKKSIKKPRAKKIRSIKYGTAVDTYNPTENLLDENRIGRAIWECLKDGDWEGVIEVIQIHLIAVNKTQLARAAHLPKTTLYHSFKSKNPTIKTLAKLIHACA
jgi:DNA-binding phage protein